MKIAKVKISIEHFKEQLHIPENTKIISIKPDDSYMPLKDFEIVVENDDLHEVGEAETIPCLDPLIHRHDDGTFEWFWNQGTIYTGELT